MASWADAEATAVTQAAKGAPAVLLRFQIHTTIMLANRLHNIFNSRGQPRNRRGQSPFQSLQQQVVCLPGTGQLDLVGVDLIQTGQDSLDQNHGNATVSQ